MAAAALVIQPVYGTFFEEFIFRGLILRYLIKYNFILANIVQASLFGFLHLAVSLTMDIPLSYKLFLAIYPTLIGLVLGYGYKKSGQNLFVTWTAHYCVNTVTWLTFLFTNKVI